MGFIGDDEMSKKIIKINVMIIAVSLLGGCNAVSKEDLSNRDLARLESLNQINMTEEYKQEVRDVSEIYVNLVNNQTEKGLDRETLDKYKDKMSNSVYGLISSEMEWYENTLYGESEEDYIGTERTVSDGEDSYSIELEEGDTIASEEEILSEEEELAEIERRRKEEEEAQDRGENSPEHKQYLEWRENMPPEELAKIDAEFEESIKYLSKEEKEYRIAIREGLKPPKPVALNNMNDAYKGEKTYDKLVEMSEEELQEKIEKNKEECKLDLVYEAYYDLMSICRYKNKRGDSITIVIYGNDYEGITDIKISKVG